MAFAFALGAGAVAAWAQGADWRERDGVVTAYMNDAEYQQWKTTGRVPLAEGRMCVGGDYVGFGSPDTGQRGPSVHVVDCGKQNSTKVCQEVKTMNQPAGPNTEAAVIHVMDCPTGQLYIYQYLNRPGFRVVRPPDWGRAIGGSDFPTLADALIVANGGKAPAQAQVKSPPPGSVEAEFIALLIAGVPDQKTKCDNAGGYGYYPRPLVLNGPEYCVKCPPSPNPRPAHWHYGDAWNFHWKNGRLVCYHCPKGKYDKDFEVCVP